MNIKKKYDTLIELIEDLISDRYKSANEIIEMLSRKCGLNIRDLNSVFQYLCDISLRPYIIERKMNAAYKYLIDSTRLDIRSAVEISGYDNQSSFTKRFSASFCMTPKEAFMKKDRSLVTMPKTWDVISQDSDCSNTEKAEDMNVVSTKFGIPLEVYSKVTEIQNLESLYQLPQIYTALAEELWNQEGMTPDDAFRYADSLHTFLGDNWEEDIEEFASDPTFISDPMERLRQEAHNKYNQFIFFDCDLSIDAGYQLEDETGFSQEALMKEDPSLLKHYIYWTNGDHVNYKYFSSAYEYFQEKATDEYTDEDLDKYLYIICCDIPKEEAFIEVVPSGSDDEYDCYILDDDYSDSSHLIEFEEDEEWNSQRIDSDFTFDPDNPYYD